MWVSCTRVSGRLQSDMISSWPLRASHGQMPPHKCAHVQWHGRQKIWLSSHLKASRPRRSSKQIVYTPCVPMHLLPPAPIPRCQWGGVYLPLPVARQMWHLPWTGPIIAVIWTNRLAADMRCQRKHRQGFGWIVQTTEGVGASSKLPEYDSWGVMAHAFI